MPGAHARAALRNVLVVLVDCLRFDRAEGLAGGARIPSITALMAGGVRFTTAIAQASLTTPSVASLFTGLFPPRHGVRSLRGYRLAPDVPTLAGELAAAGWRCIAETTGPLLPGVGLERGFHEWNCRDESENVHGPFGPRILKVLPRLPRPFFLFLHLWELHRPRKVHPRFDRPAFGEGPYDRALSSLDPFLGKLFATVPADTVIVLLGDHGEAIRPADTAPAAWRRTSRLRWREPRADRRFRRARDAGRLPFAPGDGPCHGFAVTDELIRTPLVFAGDPFPPGVAVADQVRHVDVLPTLLDALSLPIPPDLDGESLRPRIAGASPEVRPAWSEASGKALAGPGEWLAGVRIPGFKYVRPLSGGGAGEALYDLAADPGERTDASERHPAVRARLRAESEAIAARAGAPVRPDDLDAKALDERLRALGYLGDAG